MLERAYLHDWQADPFRARRVQLRHRRRRVSAQGARGAGAGHVVLRRRSGRHRQANPARSPEHCRAGCALRARCCAAESASAIGGTSTQLTSIVATSAPLTMPTPFLAVQVCVGFFGCCSDGDVVPRAGEQRRREREAAVRCDRKIVGAVVLEHEPAAVQARHRAADRELRRHAAHRNVRDIVRADDAGSVRDRARLRRTGRLRGDGHVVRRAARDRQSGT